ncbi:MAG: phosphatase PAP2 family protein [Muribaculaceae bacterium]|nr:phosphatase PAP2 family protein [Muribaculaceae bacterium]
MPIDTSSYYPEVPDPRDEREGGNTEKRSDSLNGMRESLFGPTIKPVEEVVIIEEINQPLPPPLPTGEEPVNGFERFIDTFSHVISWVLIPLVMPVAGILFIFRLSILDVLPANLQTAVTFVIAGINLFAPLLLIFLLKVMGVIEDPGLNGRKERTIPYIITALCYGASAWFMASRGAPVWAAMFFCGGALASLINMAINFKWKISAHAAAIAGLVALLIRLQRDIAVEPALFVWLLITVGAAGLLGSARIWLGRHTVWQVLAGYLVGFCSVFFLMYIR